MRNICVAPNVYASMCPRIRIICYRTSATWSSMNSLRFFVVRVNKRMRELRLAFLFWYKIICARGQKKSRKKRVFVMLRGIKPPRSNYTFFVHPRQSGDISLARSGNIFLVLIVIFWEMMRICANWLSFQNIFWRSLVCVA